MQNAGTFRPMATQVKFLQDFTIFENNSQNKGNKHIVFGNKFWGTNNSTQRSAFGAGSLVTNDKISRDTFQQQTDVLTAIN